MGTPFERYQAVLCPGMVECLYRRPVTAVLLYGNGRVVPLEFGEELYHQLFAQPRPAARQWPDADDSSSR